MKWVTFHEGVLQVREAPENTEKPEDSLIPGGALERRAVHELLFDPASDHLPPSFPALIWAKGIVAQAKGNPALIWFDTSNTIYPPAIGAMGISLDRLYVLRPKPQAMAWSVAECLRCKSVAAVVATLPSKLSRVEARRLQLAVEQGGGVGLMLRATGRGMDIYAAATRWLISPAPGARDVQRWKVELIHGHGRRIGQSFLLESRRVLNAPPVITSVPLHPSPALVDHPASASPARLGA